MDVVTVRGDEYETGLQLGKHFLEPMRESAKDGAEYMQNRGIAADYQVVKAKLEERYPLYLQHLYGRADGAGVDRDAYTLFVCAEVYEDRDRCTDIMVRTPGGECVLGHNEDGPYTEDNAALVRYETDGRIFYDFTSVDALAGGSFTFNEYGLVFTMNYMYMENRDRTGIPVWFVLREAVNARNIDEMISILGAGDYASGFSVNVADRATGRLCSIEGKLGKLDVIDVEDMYAHTNHYIHPCFNEYYSPGESNTLFRLHKSRELLGSMGGAAAQAGVKEVLSYSHESYYNSIKTTPAMGKSVTACTFLYNMNTGEITIYNHILGTEFQLDINSIIAN